MNSLTAERLCDPRSSDHLIFAYGDDTDFEHAVTLFTGAGLTKQEAVILVVTAAHADGIRQRLQWEGFNITELQESGKLVFADAYDTLASVLSDGRIDEHKFRTDFAILIDTARYGSKRPVRVFGEMVNLIWVSNPEATLRLEELGNEIIQSHSVTVLCAYSLGGIRPTSIPAPLLACHSHVLPVANAEDRTPQPVFKLHSSCVAIRREKDHRQVITIPAGASVTLVAGDVTRTGVVEVLYMDQPLQMLAVDLRTRGHLEQAV